jgi:hypothetical protein
MIISTDTNPVRSKPNVSGFDATACLNSSVVSDRVPYSTQMSTFMPRAALKEDWLAIRVQVRM